MESAAYYLVAEALANVSKHSQAGAARVRARREAGALVLSVTDDGIGGADPHGNGLTGLSDRVGAVGGRLRMSSPVGGPTLVQVAMPCR